MTDADGHTPMYLAAKHGYEKSVLAHLDSAIGRDILSLPSKVTRDTPLHECVKLGLRCVGGEGGGVFQAEVFNLKRLYMILFSLIKRLSLFLFDTERA